MKSRKLVAALLAATFIATVGLVGCGKKNTDNNGGGGTAKVNVPTGKPTHLDADQTLNLVGYDFTSLDPSVVSDTESFTSLTQVDEGLMREVPDKDGKAVNQLAGAKEMKVSDDKLTYTFTLRDDAKWSDGKTVTAQDYVYSWKRLANPKVSQDYLGFLEEIGVKGAAEATKGDGKDTVAVEAPDAKTFVVHLDHPSPYFESALSFKGLVPQRQDIVEKLGDKYGQDYKNMVFNGAYILSDYAKGSSVTYTKNEQYWDKDNVYITKCVGHIVDNIDTVMKMLAEKQLDQAGASGDYINKLDAQAKQGVYTHITGATPSSFYYVFNTQNKYLSNAKVRQALSLGFSREQQIAAVWKRYIPAYGIVTPKVMLGNQEYRTAVPEPLKALSSQDPKQLLQDGLKELGVDTDPSKITLKLLFGKASPTSTAQGQFIQNQWQKNLGIKVELVYSVDNPSYFKDRTKGNFDVCGGGWGADYNDAISFFNLFTTGNGNNNGKYSNKQYDDLINQAKVETDPAKRLDEFKQAEDILVAKDAAVAPYFYADVHTFRYPYLKNLYIPLFGGYWDLKGAYIDGKK